MVYRVALSLALLWGIVFEWSHETAAQNVKISIPSTTQAVLAFTTARDKGYYRAEGLDAELISDERADGEPGRAQRRRRGFDRRRRGDAADFARIAA